MNVTEAWRHIERRVPFALMVMMVIALYQIGEVFPFSNFPMYSKIDSDAEVLFVTDQDDKPLPLQVHFRNISSSSAKKMYRTELRQRTNKDDRRADDATPQERAEAAGEVMKLLHSRMLKGSFPRGTTALRIYLRTLRGGAGGVSESKPEMLAEGKL